MYKLSLVGKVDRDVSIHVQGKLEHIIKSIPTFREQEKNFVEGEITQLVFSYQTKGQGVFGETLVTTEVVSVTGDYKEDILPWLNFIEGYEE